MGVSYMSDLPVRVLHVDDEPGYAELVGELLEREDEAFTVETATSVSEAPDQFDRFDCIISDYDMPGQNGIDFLKCVRETAPELPFILFTGKGSEDIASEAITAGVTDYLRKQTVNDQYVVLANRVRNAVDRYRAERDRERQRAAIETAQDGISILNQNGQFIYVNQAYADLYGYDSAELVGEHWQRVYPEREEEFARDVILPTVAEEGAWSGKTTGLRADGTTFLENHRVTQTESGALICSVRNATTEMERETKLTRFRTLVETLEDPVYVLDETGEFEYVNDAFVEMVGYDRETILTSTPALIKSADTVEEAEGWLGQVLSSDGPDSVRFETEILPKNGEPIPCEDHMGVLPYDSEQFEGSVGILRDISERKARERELQEQTQRHKEFASIVSHDLRNPLNVAQGRVELAKEDCPSEHLDPVARALGRMSRIIEDMLWLADEGRDVGAMDAVSLDEITDSAWSIVTDQVQHAELRYAGEELSTATIVADDDRLRQLLENLFSNAIEHNGEDITVTVGTVDGGFYVEDDGTGIPDSSREDVFTAGYSTKDGGTGFGLRIVQQIVEGHGWEIEVVDGSDSGVRFEVTGVDFIDEST